MHPLRALAGAPLSEVGGTWGAWEKAAWVVVKQGVWWLLKAVGAVCEKLAVLEGKYEEIVAERERLAALERGSALPAPPPHCKPLKLSAAHVHSADETLSGYCDSPLDSRPLAYAEGMRRLAYGKGYRRRSPMLFPAKPKDDAAKVIDDNGRDGMGHAWLLADGKPGDFVVDLGGFADVLAVTVRNTRNGRARDRGTKDFHIEASSDMLEWRPLVRGSLRDQRAHPAPLPEPETFRLNRRLRYLRFVADSWYGKGAGLHSFKVLAKTHPDPPWHIFLQLSFLYALSRSFTPLIWLAYKADAVFNEGWEALLR